MTLIKVTWASTASRFLIAALLSALLGLFLFGVQVSIEDKDTTGIKKFFFFVLLIYAGGFSWDTLKHVTTLPESTYLRFRSRMGSFSLWFISYIASGTAFLLLLGQLASWVAIFHIALLLFALFSGVKAVIGLAAAVDAAMEKSDPKAL